MLSCDISYTIRLCKILVLEFNNLFPECVPVVFNYVCIVRHRELYGFGLNKTKLQIMLSQMFNN